MKISLERTNDAVLLRAENSDGNAVLIDGSPQIGGTGGGARPMEVLLMALGGCTSMDVLSILKKMQQPVQDYGMEIEGFRDENEVPAVFRRIHLHYWFVGTLDPERVGRAITLSMEKYCSVSKMLGETAEITYDFEIKAAR
jgi:putative redox protein